MESIQTGMRSNSALLQAAAESGKPFLGICRGIQVVNVALGGTLYTHIQDQFPGALKHDYDSGSQRKFLAHEVNVEKASQLADILGETRIKVNSLHHQGIKDLSPALRPAAYAPDGLVEAVELPNHPFGIGCPVASGMVDRPTGHPTVISGVC